MSKKKAVVIGAGIGGIAMANLLAAAGWTVTICEARAEPGGRAGILKDHGFTFDTGPSWYLMPEVFEHYFKLLGEDVEDHLNLVRLDPAYKVFFEDSTTMTIHADLTKDAKTFESLELGSGKKLQKYIERAEQTYKLAMTHFLYTNFSYKSQLLHPQILKSVPKLGSMLATKIDTYVKKFVRNQKLRQVLEYPMVFLGTSPYNAPAMYSLMSYLDFKQGVFYPKGGMYTIIESLLSIAEKHKVKILYKSPVQSINVKDGSAKSVTLKSGKIIEADIVISNADLQFTETELLDIKYQTYPEVYWRKKTPSPSALLMYLGVKSDLQQLEHHNLLFTEDWNHNFNTVFNKDSWPFPASMYVCKATATDPLAAPKGHENIFVLVPLPAQTEQEVDIDVAAEKYIDQIANFAGVKDFKKRIVYKKYFTPQDFASEYNAWRGTSLGLAHTLNQSAFFRPSNKSRKVSNLYYVGASTVPGIGLPMCLISAEVLYKRLVNDNSSGPLKKSIVI